MAACQARIKIDAASRYPGLRIETWYTVVPLFPGVTQRMLNFAGDRITRIETPAGVVTVRAADLEFRYDTGR